MIVILNADDLQALLDDQRRQIAGEINLQINRIITRVEEQGELTVATAKEVIDSIVAQLNRCADEILAKINSGTVTEADLEPLRAVATKLDEMAPAVPEEETPVEPMPAPEPNPGQFG